MNRTYLLQYSRRVGWATAVLMGLSACDANLDMGRITGDFLANPAAQTAAAPRPKPDSRGVISYPNYQVVVAKQGDTISTIAARIGLGADALARHNGLALEARLRNGEVLALPSRVASSGGFDIASIASNAIDNAGAAAPSPTTTTLPPAAVAGVEPIRHRVERGETAYSIARLYDVSVTALSSWNGLDANLSVRQGQHLLIPLVESSAPAKSAASKPGTGSSTPTPPSASKPLPRPVVAAATPTSPNLGQFRTEDSADRKFLQPVQGKIISPYSGKAGGNEGIDIAATAGTAVKAAEDGEIALVSKSVGANTIVLIRHPGNIYTVYSNIKDVILTKGQKVKRGQKLGAVADGKPTHLHFEVRKGTQSVDPAPFL